MELQYFGHSAFKIDAAGKTVLVDPFLTGNPMCPEGADASLGSVDLIALTHGHEDHVGDTVRLASEHGATVVAIFELADWLGMQGVENIVPMNIGGTVSFDDLSITMVNAVHSSSVPTDNGPLYLGDCAGLIIKGDNQAVYHAGDTDIFADMALIQKAHKPTVGLIPMGGHFTMASDTAAMACNELLDLETVVPMHWGTFPVLAPDPSEFVKAVKRGRVEVMQPGDTLEL